MTAKQYNALLPTMSNRQMMRTLSDLSASHPKNGETERRCLAIDSTVGKIQAIDFDELKRHWYDGVMPFLCKSADVLYVSGGVFYLVEFKTGKADVADIARKVYDSALALVEQGILTWSECKENLVFILVMSEHQRYPNYNLSKLTNVDYGPEWEFDPDDIPKKIEDSDVRILSGQVARKVYVMGVSDFEAYFESQLSSSNVDVQMTVTRKLLDGRSEICPCQIEAFLSEIDIPLQVPMIAQQQVLAYAMDKFFSGTCGLAHKLIVNEYGKLVMKIHCSGRNVSYTSSNGILVPYRDDSVPDQNFVVTATW